MQEVWHLNEAAPWLGWKCLDFWQRVLRLEQIVLKYEIEPARIQKALPEELMAARIG